MNNLLLKICFLLDNSRKEECSNFTNQISEILSVIFKSDYFIILTLLIFIILFKIIFTNENKIYDKYFFSVGLFFLFLIIILNFRTNIPWVDDWEWIENLQLKKYSITEWLFQPTNIHNIFFVKLLFLFVDKFLNLNIEFFSFLSIILIFIISIIFLNKEKKLNHYFVLVVIFLIFSGKQFANISQSSNIVWTLCFLYIVLFSYFIFTNKIISCLLIIIAPLTFGLGYVLPLYVIFFIYFTNLSNNTKYLYVIFSALSILISYLSPQIMVDVNHNSDTSLNYIVNLVNYKFYFTFFAVLANVYVPWVNGLSIIGFIVGLLQIIIIFYFIFKSYSEYGKKVLNKFIQNNILLMLGLLFALIVSITRPDLQTAVAARYSVGSIVFQIGFWIYFAESQKYLKFSINKHLKLLILYIFLTGIFLPYQGIHWQAKRYNENQKVIKCFFDNKDQDYCINNAYKILFYGGEWYNYEDFKLQIKNLIKHKKSFLYLSEK